MTKEEKKNYDHQYYLEHKENSYNRHKKWIENNFDRMKELKKRDYENHKDSYIERAIKWNKSNPDKIRESIKKWENNNPEKRKNIDYRYRKNHPEENAMRHAVNHMLRGTGISKISETRQYIGCSPGFLRNHLESLFESGMNWENFGNGKDKWNCDHIIPLEWWNLKNHPEHLFVASHWTNLQPMWQPENQKKGNRYCG